jgi:hypothetical protein
MSIAKDVLDTYIAENPNYKDILNSNAEVLSLNNGMPAYYHGDILLSVANVTYTFGAKSSSTKNIFLNRYEGITSNLVGAVMPRNAIILNATCAIQSPVNSCGFRIYVNGMPVGSLLTFAADTAKLIANMDVLLVAGDGVSVKHEGTSRIKNPIVTIEVAWRN